MTKDGPGCIRGLSSQSLHTDEGSSDKTVDATALSPGFMSQSLHTDQGSSDRPSASWPDSRPSTRSLNPSIRIRAVPTGQCHSGQRRHGRSVSIPPYRSGQFRHVHRLQGRRDAGEISIPPCRSGQFRQGQLCFLTVPEGQKGSQSLHTDQGSSDHCPRSRFRLRRLPSQSLHTDQGSSNSGTVTPGTLFEFGSSQSLHTDQGSSNVTGLDPRQLRDLMSQSLHTDQGGSDRFPNLLRLRRPPRRSVSIPPYRSGRFRRRPLRLSKNSSSTQRTPAAAGLQPYWRGEQGAI